MPSRIRRYFLTFASIGLVSISLASCAALDADASDCVDTFNNLDPDQQDELGTLVSYLPGETVEETVRKLKASVGLSANNDEQCLVTLTGPNYAGDSAWQFTYEKDGKGNVETGWSGKKEELESASTDPNAELKVRSGNTSLKLKLN